MMPLIVNESGFVNNVWTLSPHQPDSEMIFNFCSIDSQLLRLFRDPLTLALWSWSCWTRRGVDFLRLHFADG